jgi:hypothetical protein
MQQAPTILMGAFTGPVRNLIMGGTLCYAIQQERYWHIPVILLTPSIYAGYNLFENKVEVMKFIASSKKQLQ